MTLQVVVSKTTWRETSLWTPLRCFYLTVQRGKTLQFQERNNRKVKSIYKWSNDLILSIIQAHFADHTSCTLTEVSLWMQGVFVHSFICVFSSAKQMNSSSIIGSLWQWPVSAWGSCLEANSVCLQMNSLSLDTWSRYQVSRTVSSAMHPHSIWPRIQASAKCINCKWDRGSVRNRKKGVQGQTIKVLKWHFYTERLTAGVMNPTSQALQASINQWHNNRKCASVNSL